MVTTTANVLVVWKDETMNHGEDLDERPWPPYKHRVKRQWDTTLGTVLGIMLSIVMIAFVLLCFGIVVLGVWQLFLWLWGMTFS